jgi:hypothetical protein
VAITLGKDCTISVGGNIASARNVTIQESARTIEIEEFGSRYASVYSTGFEASVTVELNDSAELNALFASLENGTFVVVSGGAGGWSFPAVVTGISENDSVDGVATFQIEARMTREGLK